MAIRILEETEYTNTLYHMMERQRKIILYMRGPMEKALREYAYLLAK